ncbi:MAG TPA: amidohydrolase family protein [Pirellulaceae bacterium]|nr:amidohydrolase family protein [Pirellulaceae bacterium]
MRAMSLRSVSVFAFSIVMLFQVGSQAQEPAAAEKPVDAKATTKKPVTAIVGADIHTVTRGVIRNGTILIRDGKIAEVGQRLDIPADAERIDARGKVVVPGFIAMNMSGLGLQARGADRNERFADALNPFDSNMKFALGVGITTGCIQIQTGGGGGRRGGRAPDSRFVGIDPDEEQLLSQGSAAELDYGESLPTCPCCGLTYLPLEPIDESPQPAPQPRRQAVVKMSWGSLDGMLAKETVFYDATGGALNGPLAQYQFRQQVARAREYLKALAEHEANVRAGQRNQPPRNPVTEDMLRLVKREIPLRVSAESVTQIREMIALVRELDLRLVLDRATEAWLVADEISAAGVPLVITPRLQRSPRFGAEDQSGSFVEMPRILEQAGVPFAVSALADSISLNGIAGRDLSSLPLEAMFAVRGGASEAKALEALTIVPARMLGMEDRLGSIEVGKDADLLILDGQPLDYRVYVEVAFVNGRRVYDRFEDRVYPVFDRR